MGEDSHNHMNFKLRKLPLVSVLNFLVGFFP